MLIYQKGGFIGKQETPHCESVEQSARHYVHRLTVTTTMRYTPYALFTNETGAHLDRNSSGLDSSKLLSLFLASPATMSANTLLYKAHAHTCL